jgi:hypothetical protein
VDINIIISEKLLESIFNQESQKIVGKVCKRFELSTDKEEIKKQVKEILYESLRDIRDIINLYGKESIRLTQSKEK